MDFWSMDVQCQFCGALHCLEEWLKCRSAFGLHSLLAVATERYLPPAKHPPSFPRALLTGKKLRDRKFRFTLRDYNGFLPMSSAVAL